MPKISVLMPVYNAGKFLDESISSIVNQSFSDFEFLILDDQSKDNSLQIIEKYAKKDSRIRVLKNKINQGEGFCRNKLVADSKAVLIAWMDSDDISFKHRLKTQFLFLEKHSHIDVVGCNIKTFCREKKYIDCNPSNDWTIKSRLLIENSIAGPTVMVRKAKQVYAYDKKVRYAPDYLYWIRNAGNFYFHNLPEILYKYRINFTGLSQSQKKAYESFFPMVKEHFSRFGIKGVTKNDFLVIKGKKKDQTLEDLESSLQIIKQILNIQNFYAYQGVDKEIILKIYISKIFDSWSKSTNFSELETGKKFIEKCMLIFPPKAKIALLVQFYERVCRKFGNKGKIFFVRQFGVKNLFKVKYCRFFIIFNRTSVFWHIKNRYKL